MMLNPRKFQGKEVGREGGTAGGGVGEEEWEGERNMAEETRRVMSWDNWISENFGRNKRNY